MDKSYALAILAAPIALYLIDRWDARTRRKHEGRPSLAYRIAFRCGGWIRQVRGGGRRQGSHVGGKELP